jgi:hypothetical protein
MTRVGASEERRLLKTAFADDQWYAKVDNMPKTQVIAVLQRLQSQNVCLGDRDEVARRLDTNAG